jgi:hypothetical protein
MGASLPVSPPAPGVLTVEPGLAIGPTRQRIKQRIQKTPTNFS